jgi:hypothetical protein
MSDDKKDDKDKKKSTKKDFKGKDPSKYLEMDPVLENQEEVDEALTLSQRKKRGRTMKRLAGRIARKKKISMRKKASNEKLIARSEKKARGAVKAKLAGGKKYNDLSMSQKIQIDKRLETKKALVKRIAKKMMPEVRKKEVERMARLRSKKEDIDTSFEDFLIEKKMKDDPCWDDYEMVGTKKKNGKEVPNCVPKEDIDTSFENFILEMQMVPKKHFHQLFDKNKNVKCDMRFKMFKKKTKDYEDDDLLEDANSLMDLVEDKFSDDSSNREQGTDSLVDIYKKDTPGQDVKETYHDSEIPSEYGLIEKGDRVSFTYHSLDMTDEVPADREGTVVGSNVSHLRIRCDDGKLYKVRHMDAELAEKYE